MELSGLEPVLAVAGVATSVTFPAPLDWGAMARCDVLKLEPDLG